MGCKLKTALTLVHSDLKSTMSERQLGQKMTHDNGLRLVPSVQPGDAVYARNFRQGSPWVPATVSSTPSDHITDVTLPDGRCWRRHQGHPRPDLGQPVVPLEPAEQAVPSAEAVAPRTVTPVLADPAVDESSHAPEAVESQEDPPTTPRTPSPPRRCGRSRKPCGAFYAMNIVASVWVALMLNTRTHN